MHDAQHDSIIILAPSFNKSDKLKREPAAGAAIEQWHPGGCQHHDTCVRALTASRNLDMARSEADGADPRLHAGGC